MKKPKPAKKYNHLFDMAFSVESEFERGDDVPAGDLLVGLMQRVADIAREMRESQFEFREWAGNCGDSYEVDHEVDHEQEV